MLGHVLSSTTTLCKTFRKAKMCQRRRSVKAAISPKHSFLIKHRSLPGAGRGEEENLQVSKTLFPQD